MTATIAWTELKIPRILLLLLLCVLRAVTAWGADQLPVKVGVVLPLSGDLAVYGEKLKKGIVLAQEEYGQQFQFIYEDGQKSNHDALTAFQKLVDNQGVKYIIGPFGPGQTLAAASQAKAKGVLLVALSMCEQRYQNYDNIFCIYPAIDLQAAPLYKAFAREKRPVKRIAVIFEETEVINYLADSLEKFAAKNDSRIVYKKIVSPAETDYRPYLIKIKQLAPDLFVAGAFPANAIQILKQAHELQINPKYRWYLSEHDAGLFSQQAKLLHGIYTQGTPPALNPDFVSKFSSRFNQEPDFYSAATYDAARLLIDVLKQRPVNYRQAAEKLIRQRLENPAVAGFHFRKDRTVYLDMAATRIENGKKIPID